MKKLFRAGLILVIGVAMCHESFAAQQSVSTITPGTGTSGLSLKIYTDTYINPRLTNINLNDTDLYTNKANKVGSVMLWSEWANGASFTTLSPPVAYNGSLYKCTAPYTKVTGETPDTQTEYFAEVTRSGGGIAHATSDGAYYASKDGAWASLAGVFAAPLGSDDNYVTDAEKIKIAGIATGAEVNVNADWNSSSGDSQILNKPTIPVVSDAAYGSGWNGDTGAASKNSIYDKIETIAGGSMTYPGAGVPKSTGTTWDTSYAVGTSANNLLQLNASAQIPAVSAALLTDTFTGALLGSTTTHKSAIQTLATELDNAVEITATAPILLNAGTGVLSMQTNAYQAYDADLTTWGGITPGTGVGAMLAIAPGSAGGPTTTIASGTSTLGVGAIASGACASAVTTTATNTATTDVINWGFNGDPTGVTGYTPSANGMLTIIAYPSAGSVNYKVCNNTAASITPGAVTLNWRVQR